MLPLPTCLLCSRANFRALGLSLVPCLLFPREPISPCGSSTLQIFSFIFPHCLGELSPKSPQQLEACRYPVSSVDPTAPIAYLYLLPEAPPARILNQCWLQTHYSSSRERAPLGFQRRTLATRMRLFAFLFPPDHKEYAPSVKRRRPR